MALSVLKDRFGPDWPLGIIVVAASGTPVNIMSLVDSGQLNAPGALASVAGANIQSVNVQQLIFRATKSVGPVVENAGAIYILRAPAGSGTGNKTDSGVIVAILQPTETFILGGPPISRNAFTPYNYWIDADTNADGVIVTAILG